MSNVVRNCCIGNLVVSMTAHRLVGKCGHYVGCTATPAHYSTDMECIGSYALQ